MSTNATAATGTTTASTKVLRKKYGINRKPLLVSSQATAYRKDMAFDEEHGGKIVTESWVVMDPTLVATGKDGVILKGTVIRANTYDKNLGDRADYLNENYIRDIPPVGSKDHKKITKGYTECPLSQVPFVQIKDTDQADTEETEENDSQA